jgi:hypothetical protein
MAHNEQSGNCAESQEEEAVFVFGMLGIMHEQSVVVAEYSLALFKRNTMLPLVAGAFSFVPCEPNWFHAYIVVTQHLIVKVPVTGQQLIIRLARYADIGSEPYITAF